MFTEKDIQQIKEQGLTIDIVKNQIQDFESGFPFQKIYNFLVVRLII